MKPILVALLLFAGFTACNNNKADEHAHNSDGSHPEEGGLQNISHTIYSAKSELFVEFRPLVAGSTSRFAAHLTKLGEQFLPYTEGEVTVSLIIGEKGIKNTADAPSSPGIFRLALSPLQPGVGKLVFDIRTREFTDQVTIDSVVVYADEKTALAAQPAAPAGSDISYLKEQAWKSVFANTPVVRQTMRDIIKTSGQIISAPGDEITLSAKSSGIVRFSARNNVPGTAVRSGQNLFLISGGDVAVENIDADIKSARAEMDVAKAALERANELIADKLITQAEFQNSKLQFEKSQIRLNNLTRNYSASGKSLSSPINGFIKSLLVSEGQFVTAGQPLSIITKNQRLLLRADVSLKEADRAKSAGEANFTIIQCEQTFSTRELNGKVIAIARTTGDNNAYIPVFFEIDSQPCFLPGSFAEIFLKTGALENVLTIPTSALIEEQGNFFVYVQTAGESFQKRELKLGANDGKIVQVTEGLAEGERVVTRGAYQIKLATISGALPAHGHEH